MGELLEGWARDSGSSSHGWASMWPDGWVPKMNIPSENKREEEKEQANKPGRSYIALLA